MQMKLLYIEIQTYFFLNRRFWVHHRKFITFHGYTQIARLLNVIPHIPFFFLFFFDSDNGIHGSVWLNAERAQHHLHLQQTYNQQRFQKYTNKTKMSNIQMIIKTQT